MFPTRTFYAFFFIAVIFSAYSYGQSDKPAVFTSAEGGFSIELAPPHTTETIPPVAETHSGGKRYSWQNEKGIFTAGYLNLLPHIVPKTYLASVSGGMIEAAGARGVTLKYKKDISLGDMPGVEFVLVMKDGEREAILFTRIYGAKGRLYILDALWHASQTGAAEIKVLDTFRPTAETKSAAPAGPAPVLGPFVSGKGGFSIALPAKPTEETGTDRGPGGEPADKSLTWWLTDSQVFSVSYVDSKAVSKEDGIARVKASADGLIGMLDSKGGKLVSRRDIAVGEHFGVEVRYSLKQGAVAITRYYIVDKRMFIITTIWLPDADDKDELKILDSFKIISPAAPKPVK